MVAGFVDEASVRLSASETISAALKRVQASISQTLSSAAAIGPRISGVFSGIQKRIASVGDSVSSFGGRMQGIGAKLAVGGGLVGGMFAGAVNAAADLGEINNRFDALWQGQSANGRKFAAELGESVGRSQPQLLSLLSDFQGLASGLKMDAAAAAAFSQQMTSATLDLASFNNLTDEEAAERMLSALTGSSEVLRKFGVDISAAALKARGVGESATELEKVKARYELIQETMARQNAIGDAEKTAGSYANTMKRLGAVLQDIAVTVGQALLPQLTSLANSAVGITKNVQAWITQNSGLVVAIAAVAAGVVAAGIAIAGLGTVIGGVGAIISGLAAVLGFILSPIGLIVAGLAAIAHGFGLFDTVGKSAMTSVGSAIGFVKDEFGFLVQLVSAGQFAAAFQVVTASAVVIWHEFIAAIKTAWIKTTGWIESVWRAMGFVIVDAFKSLILKDMEILNSMIDGLNAILPESLTLPKIDTSASKASLDALRTASQEVQDEIHQRMQSQIADARKPAEEAAKAWSKAKDEAKAALDKATTDAAKTVVETITPQVVAATNNTPTVSAAIKSDITDTPKKMKGRVDSSLTALDMRSGEGMQSIIDAMNNSMGMTGVEDRLDKVEAAIAATPAANGAAFKAALDAIEVASLPGKNPGN